MHCNAGLFAREGMSDVPVEAFVCLLGTERCKKQVPRMKLGGEEEIEEGQKAIVPRFLVEIDKSADRLSN